MHGEQQLSPRQDPATTPAGRAGKFLDSGRLLVRSESSIVRIRAPGLELDNLRDRVEHATQVAAFCKRQDVTHLAGKIRLGLDPSRLPHLSGDRPRCAAANQDSQWMPS